MEPLLQARIPSVLYVIGIGVLLLVVTSIVNNRLMMQALSWFVLVMAVIWVILFALSRFNSSPVLACAVQFWNACFTTAPNPINIPSAAACLQKFIDKPSSEGQANKAMVAAKARELGANLSSNISVVYP
jgi:hypothetical protein